MPKPNAVRSYQEMAEELAAHIEWFESDEVDLDRAIERYEQAMKLIAEMEDYLKTAENKVKKIAARFDNE